jgi:hypothetical protein
MCKLTTNQDIDKCSEVTLQLALAKLEEIEKQHWQNLQNKKDGYIEWYETDALPIIGEALKTLKVAGDVSRYGALLDFVLSMKLVTPRFHLITDAISNCDDENAWGRIFDRTDYGFNQHLVTKVASETLLLLGQGTDSFIRLNTLFGTLDSKALTWEKEPELYEWLNDYDRKICFKSSRHDLEFITSEKTVHKDFESVFAFRATDDVFVTKLLKKDHIDAEWMTEAYRRDLDISVYEEILQKNTELPYFIWIANQDKVQPKTLLLEKYLGSPNTEMNIEEVYEQIGLRCLLEDWDGAYEISELYLNHLQKKEEKDEYEDEEDSVYEVANKMYGWCALFRLNYDAVRWHNLSPYPTDLAYEDSLNSIYFAYQGFQLDEYDNFDEGIISKPKNMYASWFRYKFLGCHSLRLDYEHAMRSSLFKSDEKLFFQQYRIAELLSEKYE